MVNSVEASISQLRTPSASHSPMLPRKRFVTWPDQGCRTFEVGNRRVFERRKVLAGTVESDGSSRDDDRTGFDVGLNRTRRTGTKKSPNTELGKLFHCDRRRWSTDASRTNDDRMPVEEALPRREFACRYERNGVVGQCSDPLHSTWVAGQDGERCASHHLCIETQMEDVRHSITIIERRGDPPTC